MKTIDFSNPHRRKHFDFFSGMNHPHFGITANVEITSLLSYLKEEKLSVNLGLVYLLARTANEIPEFRWRIRDKEVVEHSVVNPSFTVPTDIADVFSFCTVGYVKDSKSFIENAMEIKENMRTNPSFEDEGDRDDYLFLSAIPWVSFTGIQHAMHYHPSDSVPRISWGKFFEQNDKILMPLAIQAHHALVDGRHMGAFFQNFETMAAKPSDFF